MERGGIVHYGTYLSLISVWCFILSAFTSREAVLL